MERLRRLPFVAAFLRGLAGSDLAAPVLRGSAVSLAIQIGGFGLSYMVQVFLAWILGSDEYGVYIFATAPGDA